MMKPKIVAIVRLAIVLLGLLAAANACVMPATSPVKYGAYTPPRPLVTKCTTFTNASTVFVPEADVTVLDVEACGGGGGGGYGTAGALSAGAAALGGGGGGGGVGGWTIRKQIVVTPSVSETVTLGAGGTGGTSVGAVLPTAGGTTTLTVTSGGAVLGAWFGGAQGNSASAGTAGATKGCSNLNTATSCASMSNAGLGGTGGGNTPNAGGAPSASFFPWANAWWGTVTSVSLPSNPTQGTSAASTGGGGGVGGSGGVDTFRVNNVFKIGGNGGNGVANGGTGNAGGNGQGYGTGTAPGTTNTCGAGAGGGGGGANFGPTGSAGAGGNGGGGDLGSMIICRSTAYFVPPCLPLIGLLRRRRRGQAPANDAVTELREQWRTAA